MPTGFPPTLYHRPAGFVKTQLKTNQHRALQRSRLLYVILAALVMGSGLLWRSRFLTLPPIATKYGGDLLWALLIFCGFAFVFRRASAMRLALLALGFSWVIEFSQLYHAEWIDRIRATRLGSLVLGSTFNWPDLLAYAAGIAAGVLLDRMFYKANGKQSPLTSKAQCR